MTLKELYDLGVDRLDEADVDSPEVDAFYLLEYLTGYNRASYLLHKDREVTPNAAEMYLNLIARRSGHIPYQYITGEADFMGLKFRVTPDVLIPRLDTEVLIDEALKKIPENAHVLDMCTGSGCLAITTKKFRPDTVVTACDISEAALKVAQENAQRILGDPDEIRFIQGDLFERFASGDTFDVIISNPPYVTDPEYLELSPEVRDHEPELALVAGEDGLDIYRRLIPDAAGFLNGYLFLEIGYAQAEAVSGLMEKAGFQDVQVVKDLAGLDRVVYGHK